MKIFKNLKSISDQIDPNNEPFIVKNVIDAELCHQALEELSNYQSSYALNEYFFKNNWYNSVDEDNAKYFSFSFNSLGSLKNSVLPYIYSIIFETYKKLGDDIEDDFDFHVKNKVEGKTINPLVFWYPCGVGKLDWHQHPPIWQKFQLLINLTQPDIDYKGGNTHIKMSDGSVEIFDHNFEKGDMFCFPYTNWHKVDPVLEGQIGNTSKRVSILMPLHPRIPIETKFGKPHTYTK